MGLVYCDTCVLQEGHVFSHVCLSVLIEFWVSHGCSNFLGSFGIKWQVGGLTKRNFSFFFFLKSQNFYLFVLQ